VVKALDARRDLSELAYDAEARRLGMDWIAPIRPRSSR
jgi:hypothetical protein